MADIAIIVHHGAPAELNLCSEADEPAEVEKVKADRMRVDTTSQLRAEAPEYAPVGPAEYEQYEEHEEQYQVKFLGAAGCWVPDCDMADDIDGSVAKNEATYEELSSLPVHAQPETKPEAEKQYKAADPDDVQDLSSTAIAPAAQAVDSTKVFDSTLIAAGDMADDLKASLTETKPEAVKQHKAGANPDNMQDLRPCGGAEGNGQINNQQAVPSAPPFTPLSPTAMEPVVDDLKDSLTIDTEATGMASADIACNDALTKAEALIGKMDGTVTKATPNPLQRAKVIDGMLAAGATADDPKASLTETKSEAEQSSSSSSCLSRTSRPTPCTTPRIEALRRRLAALAPAAAVALQSHQQRGDDHELAEYHSTVPAVMIVPSTTAPLPSALPVGWDSAKDPGTGNEYFFHRGTGRTQWNRPDTSVPATTPHMPAGWTVEHTVDVPALQAMLVQGVVNVLQNRMEAGKGPLPLSELEREYMERQRLPFNLKRAGEKDAISFLLKWSHKVELYHDGTQHLVQLPKTNR